MFDYLELDYESRKQGISKSFYKRNNISFFSAISIYFKFSKQRLRLKRNKTLLELATLLLVIISTLALLNPIITKFTKYSKKLTEETIIIRERKNQVAFNFLINAGKNRLIEGRIKDAYKEFKLAYNIYPENEELYKLLIETVSILCEKDSNYCNELDSLLYKGY